MYWSILDRGWKLEKNAARKISQSDSLDAHSGAAQVTRDKSAKHLDFIRSLPCAVCGDNVSTEAAHVRFSDPRAAKPITGMGTKPDDCWTVPLCNKHHSEQHSFGEAKWWRAIERDPVFLAMALHRVSGNHNAGEHIIQTFLSA